jgi:carbon monoxide dehydrogenase subunit G
VGDDKWVAVLKVGVAGITGAYEGTLEMQDKREPDHYTLLVQVQGAPGHLKGVGEFNFAATAAGGTEVQYVWEVQVGGLVASVGQRVLGGVGKMLIDQFMQAMAKALAT